jgi:hypothetical protein
VKLEQVSHHQRLARLARRRHRVGGLFCAGGQRLLHKAVLARAQHFLRELGVRGHRRCEHDGVERRVRQQV